MKEFDLVVIGAGPGGYPAAIKAAQAGLSVALIEGDELGGTCLNCGCIPSKSLIHSARVYHTVANAEEFGVEVTGFKPNMAAMTERAAKVVLKIRRSLGSLLKANGIEIFKGFAKFTGKGELKVEGEDAEQISFKQAIIASGSSPRVIPLFDVDGETVHDSTSILQLKRLPKSLVVIGGGVIGSEFASLFSLLGVKVTIVEMLPRILSTESEALSTFLTQSFKKRGMQIHVDSPVEKIEQKGVMNQVTLDGGEEIMAEMVLVAVGRAVHTDRLNLGAVGLAPDARGALEVDEFMRTGAKGIYAIGDVIGKWWLAHVATHQGLLAVSHLLGETPSTEFVVPSVVFTDPEMASCGMSEAEAVEKGHVVEVSQFPYAALGKAQAIGEKEGFVRLLTDQATGQILGAEVAGADASTMIAEMAVAIENELTVECIAETIHAHPTLPEAWMEAAHLAMGHALHLPPKRS